jgi:hypothetical protein
MCRAKGGQMQQELWRRQGESMARRCAVVPKTACLGKSGETAVLATLMASCVGTSPCIWRFTIGVSQERRAKRSSHDATIR